MMELSQRRTAAPRASISGGQESRLVIALVILLVTLAAVLIKDRQFWFGSESTIVEDTDQPTAVPATPAPTQTATKAATPAATPAPSHPIKKQVAAATAPAQPKPAEAPVTIQNRTVVPPLNVEVVAGDKHQTAKPASKTAKVQVTKPAAPVAHQAPVAAPAVNAAQRERLAEAIQPSYPPLAQHMNVQGSVVLQALIAADGTVESLHKLSGPEILASAAQQAVREWRFKPVYQNGQAVETRATITVNFTIKVADSAPNTTLASNDVTISNQ